MAAFVDTNVLLYCVSTARDEADKLGGARRAEHQIEGRPGVAPAAAGPAEHRVRPRASALSRSYASIGWSCTGVAVASSRLFVRGEISRTNFRRLLGCAVAKARLASRFRRRARCASSRMTHSTRMFASQVTASEPRVIRPVETIPTRRGQRRIDSGPAPGCSTPCSSTHCPPVQTADGSPSNVSTRARRTPAAPTPRRPAARERRACARAEEIVEALEPRPGGIAQVFRASLTPLAAHGGPSGLGHRDVRALQRGVADDTDVPPWTLSSVSPATSRIDDEK